MISGFDPSRSGGPQVPAPLEVKTCMLFLIRIIFSSLQLASIASSRSGSSFK
jgi:hypothetical protein